MFIDAQIHRLCNLCFCYLHSYWFCIINYVFKYMYILFVHDFVYACYQSCASTESVILGAKTTVAFGAEVSRECQSFGGSVPLGSRDLWWDCGSAPLGSRDLCRRLVMGSTSSESTVFWQEFFTSGD